jgi:hypothetical protein
MTATIGTTIYAKPVPSPRLEHRMRTREELMKIKEAFALAMLDLLDVYDELLATGRVYVADDLDKETDNAKYE